MTLWLAHVKVDLERASVRDGELFEDGRGEHLLELIENHRIEVPFEIAANVNWKPPQDWHEMVGGQCCQRTLVEACDPTFAVVKLAKDAPIQAVFSAVGGKPEALA